MAHESRESVVRLNVKLLEQQKQQRIKTQQMTQSESPVKLEPSENGTASVENAKNLAEFLKEERRRLESLKLERQKKNQMEKKLQKQEEIFETSLEQDEKKPTERQSHDATPPLGLQGSAQASSKPSTNCNYQNGLHNAALIATAAAVPHSLKLEALSEAGDSVDSSDVKMDGPEMSNDERRRQEKNREASKQWRQRKKQQESEREQKLIQMRFVNESLKLANQMNVMRRDFLKQLIEQRDRLMTGLRTQTPAVSTATT